MATPNPGGSIGFGLNIVTTPNGAAVHVRATIQLPRLRGSWSDNAGDDGTFVFNGSAAGIGPRPAAGAQTFRSLSVTGSGSFGGPLSAPSLSVTGAGAFGGTVSAGQVTAGTATLGALSSGSVVSTGSGTFAGALAAASIATTGNGAFGGAVSGGSLSVANNGTFGGTVAPGWYSALLRLVRLAFSRACGSSTTVGSGSTPPPPISS